MMLLAAAAVAGHLLIAQTGGFAGDVNYQLRCGPPGGTLPRAARACRAIAEHPELLRQVPAGTPFPCPFGPSSFTISGRYAGARVHARFGVCFSGQNAIAARWGRLVPSDARRLRVRPDRGIGLLRLGERRSRIQSLYGHGLPAGFTVVYGAGRAVAITSSFAETTIAGAPLAASYRALRRRLRHWRAVRCGTTRELVHGAGPATVLVLTHARHTVTVQRAAPAC